MKPRSYQCELPGSAVTSCPTQPPVHDSAVASIQPRAHQLVAEFAGELVKFFVAYTSHCSPLIAAMA